MSAVRPSPTTPGTFLCPRCGNTLRDDQGWCLECGLAARTRIHPPPSWRVPVILTCVALALLAAGIAVALVTLLDKPQSTPAPATVTVPAATAPATMPPAATAPTAPAPQTTVPTTTRPAATTPGTTTPTTATTTQPGTTTSSAAPSGGATQRTLTTPGAGIRLPANAK
ncbi:MAG TPA: hypothetical protein VFF79_20365 [Conexibacter sp.]|nr:hypothetical protein [Conexibacter sp.]